MMPVASDSNMKNKDVYARVKEDAEECAGLDFGCLRVAMAAFTLTSVSR